MKTDIPVHLWSYLAEFFLEWEMFQTKVVEKTKTQICLMAFFRKSYRVNYCRKIRQSRRGHRWTIITCRMRFAYRITKATNTVCNICCPRQHWLRERVSVLRYTHIVRFVHFNASIYQTVGSNMWSNSPVLIWGVGWIWRSRASNSVRKSDWLVLLIRPCLTYVCF